MNGFVALCSTKAFFLFDWLVECSILVSCLGGRGLKVLHYRDPVEASGFCSPQEIGDSLAERFVVVFFGLGSWAGQYYGV